MPPEERSITQPDGKSFRVAHEGQTPDDEGCIHPIIHQGTLLHEGHEKRPLYHKVHFTHDESHALSHRGALTHRVDPATPVPLDMRHSTQEPVKLDLQVRSLGHQMGVTTTLQDPIHHALQLKTPLQVRFVNPWHAQSEYSFSLDVAGRTVMSLSVRGSTVFSPREPEPEVAGPSVPRVRTMRDVTGRE